MEESRNQAPLPPHLLKEKDAAEPGGHLHDARNHLCEVEVHAQILQLEAQREIAVTHSKPEMKPGERHSEREGRGAEIQQIGRNKGRGRGEQSGVGMGDRKKHRALDL